MPTAPLTPQSHGNLASQIDQRYLLMAATDLNSAGRLFEPPALSIPDARPLASFGGRSVIEAVNPELGPSDVELRRREREMEKQRRRNAR